jgi:GT2 family glycosyltransferase
LDSQPRVAVVCGRRRERYPELTVYNKLCDIEWDTPCGETETCGGDAMMRMSALQDIGGFRASLIAGEEPELCLRLRQRGWKVLRMDAEMTVHDADMRSFGQWWRRAQRSGFALAEGLWLHGGMPERDCWRETFSALLWGLLVPVLIFVCALKSLAMALLLAIVYPLQAMRIGLRRGLTYGIFCLVQKFAETVGVSQFILRKLLDRPVALIEYK